MSSSSSSSNKPLPPLFNILETSTTVLQKQTEKECSSYFIDLSKLSVSEIKNLQQIGLLSSSSDDDDDGQEETQNQKQPQPQIPQVQLLKQKHCRYLEQVWKNPLKAPFVSLDSSRPWMLYWCLNGYDLMTSSSSSSSSSNSSNSTRWITDEEGSNMCTTLEDCWQGYYITEDEIVDIVSSKNDKDKDDEFYYNFHEDDENRTTTCYDETGKKMVSSQPKRYYCGGFGGGPGQMAHAATTYAAILSLCILATSSTFNNDDIDDVDLDYKSSSSFESNIDIDYRTMHYSIRAKQILKEIRIPLYRWMCSLQVVVSSSSSSATTTNAKSNGIGGYRMAHDSEIDVRATYTVVCCAQLLGLLKTKKIPSTNTSNTVNTVLGRQEVINYVISCQTYEGGFGSEPFTEAHGGYTFCGIAALKLLLGDTTTTTTTTNKQNSNLDLHSLTGWLSRRQTTYEGGFSGRTNKLVDGCYSFWQGSAIAVVSSMVDDDNNSNDDPWLKRHHQQQKKNNSTCMTAANDNDNDNDNDKVVIPLSFPLLYNIAKLERYILLCAQEPTGGLRDKPSKSRDFYHTCYNLCGLSIAQQHHATTTTTTNDNDNDETFGDQKQTLLNYTHPVYNIRIDRVAQILNMNWK